MRSRFAKDRQKSVTVTPKLNKNSSERRPAPQMYDLGSGLYDECNKEEPSLNSTFNEESGTLTIVNDNTERTWTTNNNSIYDKSRQWGKQRPLKNRNKEAHEEYI